MAKVDSTTASNLFFEVLDSSHVPNATKFQDLTGRRYRRLVVTGYAGRMIHDYGTRKAYIHCWWCRCDCGQTLLIRRYNLDKAVSCGCYIKEKLGPRHHLFEDLTGQTFGRLTVIYYAGRRNGEGVSMWKCRCECGGEIITRGKTLRNGMTKSCGCLAKESRAARASSSKYHTAEYQAYMGAKGRCTNRSNPKYHRYGGRGIQFKFASFDAFLACVGCRPSADYSLDRIDVNKGYEPGNLRWASREVQANNKRSNRFIEFAGERLSIAQACRKYGFSDHGILLNRLDAGWCVECALTKPRLPRGTNKLGCPHKRSG